MTWHLITVTTYGPDQQTTRVADDAKTKEWTRVLGNIDASHRRSCVPVVLAVRCQQRDDTTDTPPAIGKAITLKRCDVCDQLKAPRRRHVCDRHFDPRVGDVFHRINIRHKWIGEGSYSDHSIWPQDHPHLFREERTTDVVEVTGIEVEAAWSYGGDHYPAQTTIKITETIHDRDDWAAVAKQAAADCDVPEWRCFIEASTERDGWTLVTKGTGRRLSEVAS